MTTIKNSRGRATKSGSATVEAEAMVQAGSGSNTAHNFLNPVGTINTSSPVVWVQLTGVTTPANATHLILTAFCAGTYNNSSSTTNQSIRQDTVNVGASFGVSSGRPPGYIVAQRIISPPDSGTHTYDVHVASGAAQRQHTKLIYNFITVDEDGIVSVGSSVEPIQN